MSREAWWRLILSALTLFWIGVAYLVYLWLN